MKDLFSFFQSYTQTTPSDITLANVYSLITADPALRDHTVRHRLYLQAGDGPKADREKKSCHAFTPAVRCDGGRQRKHIVTYTGVSLCDLDDIPPGRMAEVIRLIQDDPHTLLVYTTVSGKGLRILFPFEGVPAEDAEPAAQETLKAYQEAYRQGNDYYARLVGQAYDGACKNPERISGLAHDPDAYLNAGAIPLTIHPPQEQEVKKRDKPGRPCQANRYRTTPEKAAAIVKRQLEDEGVRYEAGHHNEYIMRLGYLFNLYGVPGDDAIRWAVQAFADYGAATVESILHSCYRQTEEHGTRRLRKDKVGGSSRDDAFATVDEIEAFLVSQAEFRHNVITRQCEIRWKEDETFQDLTDRDANTLWSRMSKTGSRTRLADIYNVIHSEFTPLFHPFKDYFGSLPPWDGVTDAIAALANTVHVKGDQARFTAYFRKWFVGILPTLFDEQTVNHEILVFIGEQGVYKTTWFNHLLPPPLRRYFYTKTNSNRLTKDDQFTLAEFALVCFEEIDGMRPSELNQLKAMITLQHINERAAYARNKERRPHIASFCGTGNNLQFLTDPTGNRRWLPFEVESIDSPFARSISYEMVYGQALALWKSGFRYWFSQDEIVGLNRHNAYFEAPNLEEELIATYFRKPFGDETGVFVTTARILERINAYIRQPLMPTKIGAIMKKLGFEAIKYKGKRGYIAVELSNEEIQRDMKSALLGI